MSKKQPATQSDPKLLDQLQSRVTELEESWKRALADYKNLESRVERQRADSAAFATMQVVGKLLQVVDDLDRAVVHHPTEEWIKLIRKQLDDILVAEGVSEISTSGKIFDPNSMECVKRSGDGEQIVAVLSRGYIMNGRVIRPVRVEVGGGGNKQK